jgi:large subunit ribosomal protein L13
VACDSTFALLFKKKQTIFNMQSRSYSTRTVKESELKREWFIVDAEGKTLGRMTSKIASVLRGKHKPTFTPNADCGDFVIVINSAKVRMTGKKMTDRFLVRYTGYPGGQRHATPKEIIEKNANKAGGAFCKKVCYLKVRWATRCFVNFSFTKVQHPHLAQKPKQLI